MIAKILLTGLLSISLSGGLISLKSDCNKTSAHATVETVEVRQLMKTIQYEGEFIPFVALPTVEISGQRNPDQLVHAIIVEGNVYPVYELDEVTVTPGV